MKRQVQQPGVRKWFGDDWLSIQNELLAVMEGHYGHFQQQFILSGCKVTGTDVSAGIVCLNDGAGNYNIYRFEGAAGVVFPVYFQPGITQDTRLYVDGNVKPVADNYNATLVAVNSGGLLQLKQDGTTARFTDAIQDATHRFVTDTEKTTWGGQATLAINTLRDGVSSTLNTLEKLRAFFQDQIDTIEIAGTDYALIYNTIRGGIDESMDTLEKLRAAMVARNLDWNKLVNVPEFAGKSEQASVDINWNGKPEIYMTLQNDVEFNAINLVAGQSEGKTIGLTLDGAHNATFNSKFKKISGSPDPSPGETNYIQMKCTNATPGSERIIYSVMFIEL